MSAVSLTLVAKSEPMSGFDSVPEAPDVMLFDKDVIL